MDKVQIYKMVEVEVHTNGKIRIYGEGGLVFEAVGEYISTKVFTDPKLSIPSGTVK